MKLILVDRNEAIVAAWSRFFQDCDDVELILGSIFDVDCDAIVSPANSFGFMDGGLDWYISEFLGWHVMEKLQELIRNKYHGELLVGQAELIATDHDRVPYLISAPTMRVPLRLTKSVNVFLAMKAILLLLKYGQTEEGIPVAEKISTVAIPGLGTGAGELPPSICARQMRAAYDFVKKAHTPFPKSWKEAQANHYYLFFGEEKY